ncbi:MAG: hydrogen gas-evolving membrane-bound hydrogenase subunit E [Elusimicrobiota bacterium]
MLSIDLLLIFMIIAAILALQLKDLLSSVISIGFVGLGLSICFLLLKAPDLAIVQLVVEILVLIILIRMTVTHDGVIRHKNDKFLSVAAAVFTALFMIICYHALKYMPEFGSPLMKTSSVYLAKGFPATGASNIVSSIALGFRAYDSLAEIIVIFTAVIAVLAIMRNTGRRN